MWFLWFSNLVLCQQIPAKIIRFIFRLNFQIFPQSQELLWFSSKIPVIHPKYKLWGNRFFTQFLSGSASSLTRSVQLKRVFQMCSYVRGPISCNWELFEGWLPIPVSSITWFLDFLKFRIFWIILNDSVWFRILFRTKSLMATPLYNLFS